MIGSMRSNGSSQRRVVAATTSNQPQCNSSAVRPGQSGPRMPIPVQRRNVASASVLELSASHAPATSDAVVTHPPQRANQRPGQRGKSTDAGSLQARLRVAVDVDEVLGRFVHALNQYRRDHHALHFDVADYHIYDFASVWQCSADESARIVHDFFESQHFQQGIPVIPGAQRSLESLATLYDLVVVTSRQHVIREPTLRWLDTHFPDTFVDVHFGNHYALSGPSKSKSEICKQVGAQVLIDDNPRYALECARAGIHVLLFDWGGSYAWSKTECGPSHPLITRVHDWGEVELALARVGAR